MAAGKTKVIILVWKKTILNSEQNHSVMALKQVPIIFICQWQWYSLNCMEADTLQLFHCRSACQYQDGTGNEEILYQIGHTLNSIQV